MNSGLGDRFIFDQFYGETRNMYVTDYRDILGALRDHNPGDFDLPTVEKATYQKYRIENDVGNWSVAVLLVATPVSCDRD